MNRYRPAPGFGPQMATSTTTCQKCLKKGDHFTYQCKASLQDRPYVSRPSRSQQFKDPKLQPKITSTKPDELLETHSKQNLLADPAAVPEQHSEGLPLRGDHRKRRRSSSISSSTSLSTISTNRSPSPKRRHHQSGSILPSREVEDIPSKDRRKRRRSSSVASSSRSPSPRRGSPPKTRRRRRDSPDDRGRPLPRWGSHRSPSRSTSVDQSQVTRNRRSLDSREDQPERQHRTGDNRRPVRDDARKDRRSAPDRRSMSPYSRRLALTQAMNMGR